MLNLHFRAVFGLAFHIGAGFFFRCVDASVKVIFIFRGGKMSWPYLARRFARGSSSGSESTDIHFPGPRVLDPRGEQGLLSGKESVSLIYMSVLAAAMSRLISQGPLL